MKTKVVCEECGSDEVYLEAQVSRNSEAAEWEASEPHYCLCHQCDEPRGYDILAVEENNEQ